MRAGLCPKAKEITKERLLLHASCTLERFVMGGLCGMEWAYGRLVQLLGIVLSGLGSGRWGCDFGVSARDNCDLRTTVLAG